MSRFSFFVRFTNIRLSNIMLFEQTFDIKKVGFGFCRESSYI